MCGCCEAALSPVRSSALARPAPYPPRVSAPSLLQLRRLGLAVSVLHDVDLEPVDAGVELTGPPAVRVRWDELRAALAGEDPESAAGRARVAAWVLARRWAADAGRDAVEVGLRPVGLPVGHPVHLGPPWVEERVLGGALELGLGAVGVDPADRGRVVPLPPPALDALGIDRRAAWGRLRAGLEELGRRAAAHVRADPRGQLRPVGDADAVTLLGARTLRAALVRDAGGLVGAAVPTRRLGWTRLTLVDPAFAPAVAAATPAADRGFPRPLLLTADELTLVPAGGNPSRLVLSDDDARQGGTTCG